MLSHSVIIEYCSICWAMLDIVTKRKSSSLGPIHIKQIKCKFKFPIELESEIEYMQVCFEDPIQFGKEELVFKSQPGMNVVPARTGVGVQGEHISNSWNSEFFFETFFSEWKKS